MLKLRVLVLFPVICFLWLLGWSLYYFGSKKGEDKLSVDEEENLHTRINLVDAKVETLITRFNELLRRLQITLNTNLDHLQVPEDNEK